MWQLFNTIRALNTSNSLCSEKYFIKGNNRSDSVRKSQTDNIHFHKKTFIELFEIRSEATIESFTVVAFPFFYSHTRTICFTRHTNHALSRVSLILSLFCSSNSLFIRKQKKKLHYETFHHGFSGTALELSDWNDQFVTFATMHFRKMDKWILFPLCVFYIFCFFRDI